MLLRRIIYLAALVACVIFYAAYQQWFSFFLLVAILAIAQLTATRQKEVQQ